MKQPKLLIDKLPCGNGYSIKRRPPGVAWYDYAAAGASAAYGAAGRYEPTKYQARERILFAVHGP